MLGRLGFPSIGHHKSFVAAIAIDALGSGVWMPMSVLYFITVTNLPLTHVGLALTLAQATSVPFALLAGQLVDRFGSHRILQTGNLLQAGGFACFPLVHSVVGVFLVVAVTSLGRTFFFAAFVPTVLSVSRPGEREKWFGFVTALRNAGFGIGGIGTAVAVSIGSHMAFHTVVLANAASYLVAFVLMSSAPGVRGAGAVSIRGWTRVLADRGYRWLVGANFGYALGCLALNVVFPVYLVHQLQLPGWLTGVVYVINTGMIGVGQGIVVRAMAGHIRWRIIVFSASAMLVSFALLAAVADLPRGAAIGVALLAAAVFTLGEMAGGPVLASLAAEAPPEDLRGRYQAVYQLSWNISSAVAPALYLALLDRGHVVVWVVLAVVVISGSVAALAMRRGIPLAREPVTNASGTA